jgi:hypothetical protein
MDFTLEEYKETTNLVDLESPTGSGTKIRTEKEKEFNREARNKEDARRTVHIIVQCSFVNMTASIFSQQYILS